MTIKVTDIIWDTDGEAIDLPSEVDITDGIEPGSDEIADWLSDKYGFCVEGFNYEVAESFYQLLVFDTETDTFYTKTNRKKDVVLSEGFALYTQFLEDYEGPIDEEDLKEYQDMTLESFSEEMERDGRLYIQCHFSHIAFEFSKIELSIDA